MTRGAGTPVKRTKTRPFNRLSADGEPILVQTATFMFGGSVRLEPDGGPKLLMLRDEHPELERVIQVRLGKIEPKVKELELSEDEWRSLHRGLTLVADIAWGGTLVVRRGYMTWRFDASGEPLELKRRNTRRMVQTTGQVRRAQEAVDRMLKRDGQG